jgi:hypothetical protein
METELVSCEVRTGFLNMICTDVREGARHRQNRNNLTVTKIWSWAPDGVWHQDWLAGRPSVVKRSGESRGSKIWYWVPRDSEPRMTVLARTSRSILDRSTCHRVCVSFIVGLTSLLFCLPSPFCLCGRQSPRHLLIQNSSWVSLKWYSSFSSFRWLTELFGALKKGSFYTETLFNTYTVNESYCLTS